MFRDKVFPYMKAFEGADGKIYYVTCYRDGSTGFNIEDCPGQTVIDFCELDLTDYKTKLIEFINMPYSFEKYKSLCDFAWSVADILKDKHFYGYFFTTHSMSRILSRTIRADLFELDEIYRQDINDVKAILEEVLIIQEIFSYAIRLCLDKDNLPHRHISEKLIGFLFKYPQFNDFVLNTGYSLMPNIDGKLDFETVNEINKNDITDAKEQLNIMHGDGKILSVMNFSIIETLAELFYYEFMQIMKSGRKIKICKNCGKYFVLKNKRKREYCDRIYEDDKRCCDIGAVKKFKDNLEDEYLKAAQRIYRTMYSRMDRAIYKTSEQKSDKDLTEDEFSKWSKIYSKARRDYIKKIISGDEMINRIKPEK